MDAKGLLILVSLGLNFGGILGTGAIAENGQISLRKGHFAECYKIGY